MQKPHDFAEEALRYHAQPRPGKIEISITKAAETQHDLSLAYSPGVAEPVRKIAENPLDAYKYTAKGNLVAVISNGSAILGLGNLGALASKPVMEGKCLLFKHFSNIDAIDIEVDARTPDEFVEAVRRIAGSFGGINLEDIKAPECFEIERRLVEACNIPVFHDDQHGTAIVTVAGMLNALDIQGKKIEDVRIVCLGAGAAAISCLELLITLGARRDQILVLDRRGVIYRGRDHINEFKERFVVDTPLRDLADACRGADVFLGVSSASSALTPELLGSMAPRPIVFACSNPDPEIDPDLARQTVKDVIIATGRSDYPNQVNNVLGFPFIFRGALDVGASCINEEMKIACVNAIRNLARQPVPAQVVAASDEDHLEFGPDYIVPKPMDRRLLDVVPPEVARAAIQSGVARLPYPAHYPA